MSLPIISTDQRHAEPLGVRLCICGKSGVGKTSLLRTLKAPTMLFIDLKMDDLGRQGSDQ